MHQLENFARELKKALTAHGGNLTDLNFGETSGEVTAAFGTVQLRLSFAGEAISDPQLQLAAPEGDCRCAGYCRCRSEECRCDDGCVCLPLTAGADHFDVQRALKAAQAFDLKTVDTDDETIAFAAARPWRAVCGETGFTLRR